MRAVVQRVKKASVKVDDKLVGEISEGLQIYLAISDTDNDEVIKWVCNKLVNLRIFRDESGNKNISLLDISGEILIISNFTLYADVKRGARPNYMKSAHPDISKPIYEKVINYLKTNFPIKVEQGVFGAMMQVDLINDGPVTIVIDKESKN